MTVTNLALHGARKAEDHRLYIAKLCAANIKLGIDSVRARYAHEDVWVDYPSAITVDRQTFYWSQLVENT